MSWWDYVARVANTSRQRDIEDRTGIDASNFSRWKSGQIPKPSLVRQFAAAYGRPVLEAFIAAGFLDPQEAGQRPAAPPSLDQLSDDDLLDELRARLRRGDDGGNTAPKKPSGGPGPQDIPRAGPGDWRNVPIAADDLTKVETEEDVRRALEGDET